ncbi:peptidase M24 [Sulfolobales archaeon HS-7]|nr:peptidase M24 [Sulfolobales archaeon HS-7]
MQNIRRINKLLEKKECVAVFGESNVFYFTGFRGAGTVIISDGVVNLVVPVLEENRVSGINGVETIVYGLPGVGRSSHKNFYEVLQGLCREGNTLNVNVSSLDPSLYINLTSKYQVKDISEEITLMRAIKDEEELEFIRKAGEITSVALEKTINELDEGNNEKLIAGTLDYYMKKQGAEDYSFPTIVAIAENASEPHHIPTGRRYKKGDLILIDAGAKFEGYSFDTTRTIFADTREFKKIYEIVLEAQLEAIDEIAPGVKAIEIERKARGVIEKNDYGRYFIHSTGHGVGIDVHEYPPISLNSAATLEKGMVITVEPGIYLEGRFGVRIEDTIIVDEKPRVLLTPYKQI